MAGAPLLGCSSAGKPPAAIGKVQAGLVSSFPVGSLEPIGSLPVALGHDTGGLYALTLTCTHEGCNMAQDGVVSGSGIVCRCHGASYNVNGHVLGGPAPEDLTHFAVSVDAATGNVTIDGDTTVSASVRTPV
ncbi:MAG TPA: Rieske (2Fe-2S) protein [Polyangiaceae bacterium]|nr:Rieske (2Fe-2S) protein [Polyangiaceae bacterium]